MYERLKKAVGLGRKAQDALHTEDTAWHDAIERLKSEVVRSLAAPEIYADDRTKDLMVLKLQILEKLPKELENMVAVGQRAETKLKEMK